MLSILMHYFFKRLSKIGFLLSISFFCLITTSAYGISLSPHFTDKDGDGINDQLESHLGFNTARGRTAGIATTSDLLTLTSVSSAHGFMLNPNQDTDGDGINDILEINGYYVEDLSIRGQKLLIDSSFWEAFEARPFVLGHPVFLWAAQAIEESGIIEDATQAGKKVLDISLVYPAIYNKLVAQGLPQTHIFLVGSPSDYGSIANIINELLNTGQAFAPLLSNSTIPPRVYYTDPTLRSTDWDPYSDREEVLGLFQTGAPIAPANDPLIGAIPNITTLLDDIVITDIKELREAEGTMERRTDVVRKIQSESFARGVSATEKLEFTFGQENSVTIGGESSQTKTWTTGSSFQTEVRETFAVITNTTDVRDLNCFAKLQLKLRVVNNGSDKASEVQPRWAVALGGVLWQTLNGSDFLGNGATLNVGGEETFTILGQGAGDTACLTRDQANYLAMGGSVTILTGLESAKINYYDEFSGLILSDGNWAAYEANYEQYLAKIELRAFTTQNVEINESFWIRGHDKNNLPNIKVSVKEVLERAYTAVNCTDIGFPSEKLCLATAYDGYILLDDDTNYDFQFVDELGQALEPEAALVAYEELVTGSELIDVSLPRGTTLSINDNSARKPEFSYVDVIVKPFNQSGGQDIEVRATVRDYFGIEQVQFCKNEGDCYDMQPSLQNQIQNPANGYYTLQLNNYALQGNEFLVATSTLGKTATQTPIKFYLSLIGSAFKKVDDADKRLREINTWQDYRAELRVTEPSVEGEIIQNNLMDSENSISTNYLELANLMQTAKDACTFKSAQSLNDAAALVAQQTACADAVTAYEQGLQARPMKVFNPYKLPAKNNLIVANQGISHTENADADGELECNLKPQQFVTAMRIGYKATRRQNIGVELDYRSFYRTGQTDPEPLFDWSDVHGTACGNTSDKEREWTAQSMDLNNGVIPVLSEFGWSVQGGDVTKFCVVYWDFDLNTMSTSGDFKEHCDGTAYWSGIEQTTGRDAIMPGGSQGPAKRVMSDIYLNASYNKAQTTHAKHYKYSLDYYPIPDNQLINGREYHIFNGDKLLAISGTQLDSRSLALEDFNGSDEQIWIVDKVNDREFRLRPKSFDGHLGRPNLRGADGNIVSVYRTDPEDEKNVFHNQHWELWQDSNGKYSIKSVINLRYLSVSNNLQLHNQNLSSDRWEFVEVTDESFDVQTERQVPNTQAKL